VSSVAALAAVLALLGAGWGGMNVALNSAAVDVIEELGRPVMPSFHAAYSLGGLLGALVGGALAGVLSTATHLALIGALALVATAGLGAALLRRPRRAEPPQTTAPEKSRQAQEPASANAGGAAAAETGVAHPGAAQQSIAEPDVTAPEAAGPPSGRRTAVIVLIFSLIALCSAYGEGALADWGALHLRTDLHTGAGLAAGGYAAFSVAMVIGRLSGSRALRAVGRTAVLAGGGACAALGMLDAALVPSLPWALPGFVLVGLGLSNIFPAAVGRAGQLRGPAGVAAASTLGYGGFLTGPPLIGFLADRVGLPIALTSICVLAGAVSLLALAADRAEPGRERERGRVREAVSATEAEA
jgi:MFS family permease